MENKNEQEIIKEPNLENDAAGSKSKFKINLHIVFVALIVVIALVSAYRLYKWNIGTKSDYDPNYTTTDFDIETLDMIIPMDASLLTGHEDDGVNTILCLGNAPFSDDRGDGGLAARIAAKTDSVVYNCAFPGSAVACKNAEYSSDYPQDQFNFYYVVECLRNQDYSAIRSWAEADQDSNFINAVIDMEAVDMSKVDMIIIMYDSTDYNIMSPSDNPDNPYDITAYTGAMTTAIQNIQNTWPYIRIFVMSPTYAEYMDENGNITSGTVTDLGNGDLVHYFTKEVDVAMDCGVSFIDNYYGTINEDNYQTYMRDYMHYNDEGREVLAERIADIINNKTSTVTSTVAQ